MTNKISLIIPDIHLKWEQAEKIISSIGADEVIFLGDYFDDFDDTPKMVNDTCEWLKVSVNKPNRIHLFGNHDVHYAYTYRTLRCSGYEEWKYYIIRDTLSREVWEKLKWYHFLDNRWLITHAGLHRLNVPASILKLKGEREKFIKELSDYLDYEIIEGFKSAANNETHTMLNAGLARGGWNQVGGITWCDFEMEFKPIIGIGQICGHTPQRHGVPKWCILDGKNRKASYISYNKFTLTDELLDDPNKSINIDLDVYGNLHYGVWDGKKLVVGNYRDL